MSLLNLGVSFTLMASDTISMRMAQSFLFQLRPLPGNPNQCQLPRGHLGLNSECPQPQTVIFVPQPVLFPNQWLTSFYRRAPTCHPQHFLPSHCPPYACSSLVDFTSWVSLKSVYFSNLHHHSLTRAMTVILILRITWFPLSWRRLAKSNILQTQGKAMSISSFFL